MGNSSAKVLHKNVIEMNEDWFRANVRSWKACYQYSFSYFISLFTNMRILKFKSQLTIAFFASVNHLNGPLRTQNFTLTGSKGHGFWFVIGEFRSVLCVSVFQGSLLVIVVTIDGSEKRNCVWRRLLNFRVRMFVKSAVIYHCTCC